MYIFLSILTLNSLATFIFQVQYPLVNLTSTLLCNDSGVSPAVVNGKAVVVMNGGCNVSQKALIAQALGAKTLLLASNSTLVGHLQKSVFC